MRHLPHVTVHMHKQFKQYSFEALHRAQTNVQTHSDSTLGASANDDYIKKRI
jgi:hypothetical protein